MIEFPVPQKRTLVRADLTVRAVHLGEMLVDVHVREQTLKMDYPAGPGVSPTPLEVLLASLAACAANTLNLVLCRKMGAAVESLEVEARAERREEHPTVLTAIELVYHLRAESLVPEMVDRAVRIAEDQLCPVLAMLRPGTQISSCWRMD
jgi:putative redox protein